MATSKESGMEHGKGHLAMNTPPIVSPQEWEAARQQLLAKEKALTRSRDAVSYTHLDVYKRQLLHLSQDVDEHGTVAQ